MHRRLLLPAAAAMLSAHYGGDDLGGAISCNFATHAQCMASVSGTCERNVLPPPATSSRAAAKRNRR